MKKEPEIAYENGLVVPVSVTSSDMASENVVLAKIFSSQPQTYYEVDFGDGTFSNDMLPEDIIVSLIA